MDLPPLCGPRGSATLRRVEPEATPPRPLRLAVVCPCYDEAAGVRQFFARLAPALAELRPAVDARVLFVDDGSADGTLAILEELAQEHPEVAVCGFSRNFGHQAAVSAGLELAAGADAVMVLDSDLQHPPELIREFVARWREGADIVHGVRRSTADAGPLKRLSSAAFYAVFNRLSDVALREGAADFYLLSGRVRAVLAAMPERARFVRGLVAWVGFRRAELPYDAPARAAGESKYGPLRMARMALDAVLSFSVAPIRLATHAGLAVSALGALYLAYVVVRHLAYGDLVQGWASLLCVTLILGGAQLLFIGLIGEYLARAYTELKARPLYVLARPLAGPLWPADREPPRGPAA